MKKTLLTLLVFIVVNSLSLAQSTTLENIIAFRLKDSGTMYDQNNNVDGYFFLYQVNKLGNNKSEFALNILDQNLNSVATKSIIENSSSTILTSSFNKKEIAFVFLNSLTKKVRIIRFDQKGEVSGDDLYPLTGKEFNWLYQSSILGFTEVLIPVEEKGFIFSKVTDNAGKGTGYTLQFISSEDSAQNWEYTTPAEIKDNLSIKPIFADENYLIALEMIKTSKTTNKANLKLNVFDIKTGKNIISKLYSKDNNPMLINNSFVNEEGNIVLLGEYFKAGDDIYKDKSSGIFIEVMNSQGEDLTDKSISWQSELLVKIKENDPDAKDRTLVYFHEMTQSKSGDYYAIGEIYKRTANAAGIASAVLFGTTNNLTQLTITDALIYKFDKDFNLVELETFKKGKSRVPIPYDYGSPQLNAHIMKNMGAFDFVNLQRDPERDRFYINFIDLERIDNEPFRLAFISVIQNDGSISYDKVYIDRKYRHRFIALPAKLGHVLLIDFDKKAKKIEIHLEKLNVQ